MAGTGENWFANNINAWIGAIVIYFWMYVGYILSVFGMWQVSLDGLAMLDDFKPVGFGYDFAAPASLTLGA